MKKRRQFNGVMGKAGKYLCALLVAAIFAGPFLWLMVASISTQSELFSVPPHWIPNSPTLDNYASLFFGKAVIKGDIAAAQSKTTTGVENFKRATLNSLITASLVAIITLMLGATAAYAFSRFDFPGKAIAYLSLVGIRMFPASSVLIPFFLIMTTLRLIDTTPGLVLAHTPFTLTLVIIILKGYFDTIPREMEEAAEIDGCTKRQVVSKVVVPLSLPGFVAAGVFAFVMSWNEFLFALVLTSSYRSKTIPIAIAEFNDTFIRNFNLTAAGGVISAIVPVLLLLIFQRYIIAGLTAGGVKG